MAEQLNPRAQVYFTDEVAAMLRMTPLAFRRNRSRLHNAGMPQPLLHTGKVMRFPRLAIDRWLNDPNRPAGFAAANDVIPTAFGGAEEARRRVQAIYGDRDR